ncbi:MAG TPA: hypothetical protein VI385_17535 [Flavisolibacter sp.]|jgi:hypothetical protein
MTKVVLLTALLHAFNFVQARSIHSGTDSLPKVLIVKTFDASSLQVRKNKKDLFRELTDSLQVYLAYHIKEQFGIESVVVPTLAKADDSSILSLIRLNGTAAIVIRTLEVYFDEGGEKHVEEYGLSPKLETSYNLCSRVDYTFYNIDSASQEKTVNHCDFFTTRSVNDKGFVIKFGPDIVGKKRHTYGAVERNAIDYVHSLWYYLERPTSQ